MALWPYALRTVGQVKTVLSLTGSTADPLIEECVNEASQMVESAWGRHVVSRGALTEFHPREPQVLAVDPGYTPWAPTTPARSTLHLNEWPVVSVTTVHEDAARAYGASSLLVADTDYILSKPVGKLIRVAGALPKSWVWSWRSVKAVYVAGYQNTAGTITGAEAVPFQILRVFDELVGWMIRQRTKSEVGLQTTSDALGNRTFSGPAYITDQMRSALSEAGAVPTSLQGRTGERDA